MTLVSGWLPDLSIDLDVVVEQPEEGDHPGDDQLLPYVAENLKHESGKNAIGLQGWPTFKALYRPIYTGGFKQAISRWNRLFVDGNNLFLS